MARPKPPPLARQLVAIFSRHPGALDWVTHRITQQWGTIGLASPRFDHSETNYYESQMGRGLIKQFLVIDGWYDPARLPQSKLQSNAWEEELSNGGEFPEVRPLNVDPGYMTLTKLVLASCKDRAHRIYMADGVYGEECLYYLDHGWRARPWTYPDYQRADFQAFFEQARRMLKT